MKFTSLFKEYLTTRLKTPPINNIGKITIDRFLILSDIYPAITPPKKDAISKTVETDDI